MKWDAKAHAAYQAEYRERLRTVPDRDIPHGTLSGYTNFGCRCGECRAVIAEAQRRSRARRKAVSDV